MATIHCLAFPRAALTMLGPPAVCRYYEWQMDGPHDAVSLGAYEANRLEGFCVAGVFRGALVGFLRRHWAYLAWRVFTRPWLVAHPLVRSRLAMAARTLRRRRWPGTQRKLAPPRGVVAGSSPIGGGTRALGILAIAVHPRAARRGVGAALMDAVEARARAGGFGVMRLTVSVDNVPAVRFYERLGWERVPGESGRWRGAMRKVLVHA